jgi:hypothetical protein
MPGDPKGSSANMLQVWQQNQAGVTKLVLIMKSAPVGSRTVTLDKSDVHRVAFAEYEHQFFEPFYLDLKTSEVSEAFNELQIVLSTRDSISAANRLLAGKW